MASANPAALKQIRIKTGVVKRIGKEKISYEKEIDKENERLQKKISEGKDEYELRKQQEVIDESKSMVPDAKRRLEIACKDLSDLLEKETECAESEEYKAAQAALEDVQATLKDKEDVKQ